MTTHAIKEVSFTPEGGGGAIAITGLQDVQINDGGSRVTWSGDNVPMVQFQAMEDIEAGAAVRTNNQAFLNQSGLEVGTIGVLVITRQQRAEGRGAVTGGDTTVTMSKAMVTDRREGLPHRGTDTAELSFSATAVDGVTYPIAYS